MMVRHSNGVRLAPPQSRPDVPAIFTGDTLPILYTNTRRWRYKLAAAASCMTPYRPKKRIVTSHITLETTGVLTCAEGYAWDGASAPAVNTKNFRLPSLFHDAIYQLLRLGLLEFAEDARLAADKLLVEHLKRSGMWLARRAWVYSAVRLRGASAASPKDEEFYNKVHEAR
jgi:hypothetical protein